MRSGINKAGGMVEKDVYVTNLLARIKDGDKQEQE